MVTLQSPAILVLAATPAAQQSAHPLAELEWTIGPPNPGLILCTPPGS